VSDFAARLLDASERLRSIGSSPYPERVLRATTLLAGAIASGHKVLVFGNGGSAADAQHIATELVGRFLRERRAIPAIALGTNQAYLTAWSNDADYAGAFAREIEALGQPGDVAWGISTSGNSPSIVAALRRARELGLRTIGLTGDGGGSVAAFCDVLMDVPLRETPHVQEVHVITYHAICAALEQAVAS
jgi:D-sedoheptulose 7-phosphate isomerase